MDSRQGFLNAQQAIKELMQTRLCVRSGCKALDRTMARFNVTPHQEQLQPLLNAMAEAREVVAGVAQSAIAEPLQIAVGKALDLHDKFGHLKIVADVTDEGSEDACADQIMVPLTNICATNAKWPRRLRPVL